MLSLNLTLIAAIAGGVLILLVLSLGGLIARRMRHRAKFARFKERWQAIQKLCAKSETWPLAILNADTLVDETLKASGFRGRTMGERLVSAQRTLTDNDGIWFAHKLRNKIAHEEMARLYKRDVQAALRGMRQALHDLGAL